MTVQDQTLVNEYTGNGSTTEFAYTFRIIDEDQLTAYVDGVATASITIDGEGEDSGGTVTFNTAPASGTVVRLVRITDVVREYDYIQGGGLTSTELDNDQDYQTQMIQEVAQTSLRLDTSTGDWDADSSRITNVAEPETDTDAATAGYVDDLVAQIVAGDGGVVPLKFTFTGDGSTTVYATPDITSSSANAYLVFLDGVSQIPTTDFTVSVNSEEVTFTTAPPDDSSIVIRGWGYSRNVDDVETLRNELATGAGDAPVGSTGIVYERTQTEIDEGITPSAYHYDENDAARYTSPDNATAYLSLLSDIRNGERVDFLRAVPKAEWAAIRNYTSTYNTSSCFTDMFSEMDSSRRADLYITDGLFNIGAAITNMPLKIRITGSGRRSFGSSVSNWRGTILQSTFNTASPFQVVQGSLVATDILIENLGLYGTGTGTNIDGFTFTNVAGVGLRHVVVSNFTRHNIKFSGGNYLVCDNVYSSLAGNSNYYIDGEFCTLNESASDGGLYGVYATSNGYGLQINGRSHFESMTTRALHILGNRFCMVGGTLVTGSADGVYINAPNWCVDGTFITGVGGSMGFEVGTSGYSYKCTGISSQGYSTAMKLNEGAGCVTGSYLSGDDIGLNLVAGNYVGVIDGNHIQGVNHSVRTTGNGKWKLGTNRLADAASPENFKKMTVSSGYPLVAGSYEGTTPTVASASSIDLPYDTDVVNVSGTTTITSINATGHANRRITLVFTGALTLTDGSNLKLNGSFSTAANSTITLVSDGTNFYEVSRSAN